MDPERGALAGRTAFATGGGRGDEIASAVLFPAGDATSAITGTVLAVDCG